MLNNKSNGLKLYSQKYNYYISIIFVMLILILTIQQYFSRLSTDIEGLDQNMLLLAESTIDKVSSIDRLYWVIEQEIERITEPILLSLVEYYNETGEVYPNIERLSNEDEYLDIFVIDENNKIIKATKYDELGLDFGIDTSFAFYLDYIRRRREFSPERIAQSSLTGSINKYDYFASNDGKYIFETGYNMKKYSEILGNDSIENLVVNAAKISEHVEEIVAYDGFGRAFNSDKEDLIVGTARHFALKKAIEEKTPQIVRTQDNGVVLTYLYYPYTFEGELNYQSLKIAIEIKYSDSQVRYANDRILIYQATILIILLTLLIALQVLYHYNFLHPLNEVLLAIISAQNGKLNVRARVNVKNEIRVLADNFNDMMDKLDKLLKDEKSVSEALENAIVENKELSFQTVKSLANAIEAKDIYTGNHCERVMKMSIMVAEKMELEESRIEILKYSSILHDVGKIGIPDNVLNKKGRYTDEEYEIIKAHPQIGVDILSQIGKLNDVCRVILYHHERIDGNGYPEKIEGKNIPILSRILSITDAFDAMTSKRIYREQTFTVSEAFKELRKCSDSQFDSELVEIFISAYIEKYGNKTDQMAETLEGLYDNAQ